MGQGYFKPDADKDIIVHWSTFWDFPIAWGKLEEFTLTLEQIERILTRGSTWFDMPIDRDNPDDGLIVRLPFEGKELGGLLPYRNVLVFLELLMQPESKERTAAVETLLIEGHWL
ncbi:hypothetical protein SEA_MAGRITTE_230 [Microbacterium phage Magritte]|nr:hypothetical protein SEA_MAGRITTE_230 [Microbacterium phage Magritte]